MLRTLIQILIYGTAHTARAVWRILPGILVLTALVALLALCEHSPQLIKHLIR